MFEFAHNFLYEQDTFIGTVMLGGAIMLAGVMLAVALWRETS